MNKAKNYMIIFEEVGDKERGILKNRLDSIGKCEKVGHYTYILHYTPKDKNIGSIEIREILSGKEEFSCIVLELTGLESASWCLYAEGAHILESAFNKFLNEDTDNGKEQ